MAHPRRVRHFSCLRGRDADREIVVSDSILMKTSLSPGSVHCISPEADATCDLLICFETRLDSAGQGGFQDENR
jgi:hypothetical protein